MSRSLSRGHKALCFDSSGLFASSDPQPGQPWMCYEGTLGLLRALLRRGTISSMDFADPFVQSATESVHEGRPCRVLPISALSRRQQDYSLLFDRLGDLPSRVIRAREFPRASVLSLVHAMNYRENLSGVGTALQWDLYRPYDAILCSTETARKTLMAMVDFWRDKGSRFRRAKLEFHPLVRTVPFAVSPPVSGLSRGRARRRLGLASQDIVILALGRLSLLDKADCFAMLVPLARLRRTIPGRRIKVIFSGADVHGIAPILRSIGKNMGFGESLKVFPDVDSAMRSRLYAASDVFLSLSDNIQETFGLTIIEAMAHGLPVVASDWGGYRDIVRHGETGFLIPSAWAGPLTSLDALSCVNSMRTAYLLARRTVIDLDAAQAALRSLVERPELRAAMGREGLELARRLYSWDAVVRQFEDVISELRREARRSKTAPRPLSALPEVHDYSRIFGHYPSRVIGPKTRLAVSESAGLSSTRNPLFAILDGGRRQGVQTIVAAVQDGCAQVGACVARVHRELGMPEDEVMDVLLLAIKYGLLGTRFAD